ncbi:MAG TPA: 23S rRNA (guanosine(2251)-2'-O)-methyltransferase RlmB [Alphaproteobacteria bacterium]
MKTHPPKKPFHANKAKPKPAFADPKKAVKTSFVPSGQDLIYGIHAVKAALENTARQVKTIWVTENMQRDLEPWLRKGHPVPNILDKAELDKRLPKGAVHQGIAIAAMPLAEIFLTDLIIQSTTRPRTILVMLDEVTDPHNIGAILRSMSAFGAHGLINHRYNSPGVTGTLAKTATGALEHVPIVEVTNLARSLHQLQEAGFLTVGCDERATHAIDQLPESDKIVLVLGAEGKGLRPSTRAQCQIIASIPTSGAIASLNVSNAAAIALFSLQQSAINH